MIILLEGVDGSGKTTYVNKLKEKLILLGKNVDIISGLLPEYKNKITREMDSLEISKIAISSFKDVLIRINLNKENNVITILDRFLPSMFAYQIYKENLFKPYIGFIKNYESEEVLSEYQRLNKFFFNSFYVNIIYLDVDDNTIKNRLEIKTRDVLDDYFLENMNKIKSGYSIYFNDLKTYIKKENLSCINVHDDFNNELLLSMDDYISNLMKHYSVKYVTLEE